MLHIEFDDGTSGTCSAIKNYSGASYRPLGSEAMTQAEAGLEIDAKARALIAKTGLSYDKAFHATLADPANAELKVIYSGFSSEQQEQSPGLVVHQLIQADMKSTGRNYAESMAAVLQDPANRELKIAYARCA